MRRSLPLLAAVALAVAPLSACGDGADESGQTVIEDGGRSSEGGDTDGEQPPGATPSAPANPTPSG